MKYLLESGGRLGDIETDWQPLGQGGSGKVYKHPKKLRGAVVKLYHVTPKDYAVEHEAKVRAMLDTPPSHILGDNHVIQLAWPFDLVRDAAGKFRGVIMPEIDMAGSFSLSQIMAPRLRKKLGIAESPIYRLVGARNLTRVMRNVHGSGHCVIDLKPPNTRIYRPDYKSGPAFVALMDCDGFAVRGRNGQRFPAGFVTPEYLQPGVSLSNAQGIAQLGREQDLYALAVIVFQLLNNNIHPFQGIDTNGTGYPAELSQRARLSPSLYAYGLRPNPRVRPVQPSLHHWFAPRLRPLFDRAFTDSSNLPDTDEWLGVLDELCKPEQACPRDKHHWKLGDACGLCAQQGIPQTPSASAAPGSRLASGSLPPKQGAKIPTQKPGAAPAGLPSASLAPATPSPQRGSSQRNAGPWARPPPRGSTRTSVHVSAPLWAWIFSTATAAVLSYGYAAVLPYRFMRTGPAPESLLVEAIGLGAIGYICFRWLLDRLGRWWIGQHPGAAPKVSPKAKLACFGVWTFVQLILAPAAEVTGPPAYHSARPPQATGLPATQPEQTARRIQTLLHGLGYDPGPVDGIIGPKTRRALQRYANDRGITLTQRPVEVLALVARDARRRPP